MLNYSSRNITTSSDDDEESKDRNDNHNDNNLVILENDILNTDGGTDQETINAEEWKGNDSTLEFDVGGINDDNYDTFKVPLETIEPLPPKSYYPEKILNNRSNVGGKNTNRGTVNRFNVGIAGSDGDKVLFTDYAPHVFRYLRTKIYGISDTEYLESILPSTIKSIKSISEDIIAKFSEGRSGAFFFYSQDNKYLIKTLNRSESQLLLNTLYRYVEYMKKNNKTYLTKYYGLHSIKLYSKIIYFIVNGNVFPSEKKKIW